MRRREFIAALGGAAAWPLVARAQKALPVIGVLLPTLLETSAERLRGFRQGLTGSGFIEGENVTVIYRWAENEMDRMPGLAAELVRRQVTVLVTGGLPAAIAAKAATAAIPSVFVIADDPVKLDLVTSVSRPDGNMTESMSSTLNSPQSGWSFCIVCRPRSLVLQRSQILRKAPKTRDK